MAVNSVSSSPHPRGGYQFEGDLEACGLREWGSLIEKEEYDCREFEQSSYRGTQLAFQERSVWKPPTVDTEYGI